MSSPESFGRLMERRKIDEIYTSIYNSDKTYVHFVRINLWQFQ